jgi:hypothetical protein
MLDAIDALRQISQAATQQNDSVYAGNILRQIEIIARRALASADRNSAVDAPAVPGASPVADASHLYDALLGFASRMNGKMLRGQIVDGANLDMDTCSQPTHPMRFILMACFKENPPPPNAHPAEVLLSRVMSEIPWHAKFVTHDMNELLAVLNGDRVLKDSEWILSDE